MKVLVIGKGGREHALVWKLARSRRTPKLFCAPGNAGTGQEATNVPIEPTEIDKLLKFAQKEKIDLTIVGPEDPLALGIVDLFQENGLRIWGPNRKAAQFEASKAFSQRFMAQYGIPTARSGTFSDPKPAKDFAASLAGRCAVKADGLALGKGVLLCAGESEANLAVDEILVRKSFGTAGAAIVIQELLEGTEISLHALCDGRTATLFPTSQDHKRALDGDQGPNTGGMGAYSPAPFLSGAELGAVGKQILDPWLRGCAQEGIDFHGILYPGLMLTEKGPKLLEFNARFGDPETQVYMPRLENDLPTLLEASIGGRLSQETLRWRKEAAVCVVMASAGYPGPYAKGKPIHGLDEVAKLPNTKVFHAGTARVGDQIVTNGGRVLGVTAWASDLRSARDTAYAAVQQIRFEGAQYRRDIAAKAL